MTNSLEWNLKIQNFNPLLLKVSLKIWNFILWLKLLYEFKYRKVSNFQWNLKFSCLNFLYLCSKFEFLNFRKSRVLNFFSFYINLFSLSRLNRLKLLIINFIKAFQAYELCLNFILYIFPSDSLHIISYHLNSSSSS